MLMDDEAMVSKKFDAIVVGAGPSGASTAYVLASAGYKVALVDKGHFPRDKLCGGGLTGRCQKVYDEIYGDSWDEVIEFRSRGIAFYNNKEYLNRLDDYKTMHFVYRCDFDYFLARKAEHAGAEFLQGFDIVEIDAQQTTITDRQGNTLQADFLVGADGIKSIVARKIFSRQFDRDRYAIAMEAEIDKKDFTRKVDVPEIYYGAVKWGYGWVFPKKDHLTIGIAGLYRHNREIKKIFTDFLENDLGLSSRVAMKGFYLPFGSYCKQPGAGNILLVGDAAGLVDPITGEGIAFAMQSGQLAALSIIEAGKNNQPALTYNLYRKKLKKITRTIDHANYVKHLIYPEFSKRVLLKGLATSTDKHSIKYYMDLLADEISYPRYIGRLFRKSGKRIFRLLVS